MRSYDLLVDNGQDKEYKYDKFSYPTLINGLVNQYDMISLFFISCLLVKVLSHERGWVGNKYDIIKNL